MNMSGIHLIVSASSFGFVGLRPIESKNDWYLRSNCGRLILYRVQLRGLAHRFSGPIARDETPARAVFAPPTQCPCPLALCIA
jgi:hypothetical protein